MLLCLALCCCAVFLCVVLLRVALFVCLALLSFDVGRFALQCFGLRDVTLFSPIFIPSAFKLGLSEFNLRSSPFRAPADSHAARRPAAPPSPPKVNYTTCHRKLERQVCPAGRPKCPNANGTTYPRQLEPQVSPGAVQNSDDTAHPQQLPPQVSPVGRPRCK